MVKKWKFDDVDAESRVRNWASAVKKRKVDDVDAESRVRNRASAVKKRKVDDVDAKSRKRNRASPSRVVLLNDSMLKDQKKAVKEMNFSSMLDIKCHHLHYPLIKWLTGKYDKYSHEFVIPGRGRIPLNELACTSLSVYLVAVSQLSMLLTARSRLCLVLSYSLTMAVHPKLLGCIRF
jgi:hypothetical protein